MWPLTLHRGDETSSYVHLRSHLTSPIITDGGILPANVAKHQVCNAVLNFVIRFLEGLCEINVESTDKQQVTKVIEKLRKYVGTGNVPEGFGKLVEGIGKVEKNSGFNGDVGSKLKDMFDKLKEIVTTANLGNGEKVEDLNQFLEKVFTKQISTEQSGVFSTPCQNVANLFGDDKIKTSSLSTDEKLAFNSLSGKIGQVTNQANTLTPSSFTRSSVAKALAAGVKSAATAFIAEIKEPIIYTSYYHDAEWSQVTGNTDKVKTCAKIFLGCLPLYYQALTYIYWGCHDKGGGWRNLTLAGGALRSYFDSQGLLPLYVDRSKRGAHIVDSALKGFSEFRIAAISSATFTYASFNEKLQKNVTNESHQDLPSKCPLSALFHGASCYFKCKQITNAQSAGGTPKTIREMLYFLAALQFSPQYDEFDSYVTAYFKALLGKSQDDDSELKLQVADSGTSATGNTLSAADLKSHLASTFHLAPAFIGLVQEPSTSGEPWLHSLFSNSQFNLSIPSSGATLFYALADYAYALQFQLHFLYQQCSNNGVKCGWQECRYGKGITGSGTSSLKSHICPGFKCDNGNCNHKSSGNCKHNNYEQDDGCGKSAATASPLQAFLTDKLDGFHLSLQPIADSPNHLENHPPGFMCHVPMGFAGALTKDTNATGWYIYYLLDHFCSRPYSPLRQLSEKLGCLTKRTPRTLGDLFGFIWTLNYQLFNNADILNKLREALNQKPNSVEEFMEKLKQSVPTLKPSPENSGLSLSLEAMAPAIPFLYQLFMMDDSNFLPSALFDVRRTTHKTSYHGTHADIFGLYYPECSTPNTNCGPYLSPLTHTTGSAFAPKHASSYLSWVLYLTDDLEYQFQKMLEEFKNIDCLRSGCLAPSTCSHGAGNHGSSGCTCDSIVRCGSVLPLLYNYGFHYNSINDLNVKSKKSCSQFSQQLSAVIAENAPLHTLLTTIDQLLFMFRFYFVYNLSPFWIIYICIVLYIYFLRADLLHFKSHAHFPSSHTVPSISLLPTGKPTVLKMLTKLTYFIP
ncbi:variant erythrocyte surface antigen-1 family protein [Babesia caballi]|uniref:Variant erythrocyte surface antigen-1 family protein n=1 Tax=Babesia caballi TaxID=5871 RepID=A0AAV4LNP7_BABCB|nr:variant erythrocyte surface antigen-1 family protein [Babesia caballi]